MVSTDGSILSSAQSPARFGYKEEVPLTETPGAVLAVVSFPDGATLSLVTVRAIKFGDNPLFIVGGTRLDRDFLTSLIMPSGMRALLYRVSGDTFSPADIVGSAGTVENAGNLAPLIASVRANAAETTQTVAWSSDAADSESFHAIPLKSETGNFLGALLIGNTRRGAVELQRHIVAFALVVAGAGILLAILLSGWVAARVTRPIEHLAVAAQEVAAGNWNAKVDVSSRDELGALAESFNTMTRQLADQRDRLVQSERVAAWRELARRLAHELKNPLFPLQITVENLVRSREADPGLFDEVFRESTATLLAEVTNLKAIIGRFSDFSKMPQPQLQAVDINQLVRQVLNLHSAQFQAEGRPKIDARFDADASLQKIDADPDLLHRALSNLVLNALDAMPNGGRLLVRTQAIPGRARIEVSDNGSGIAREECERLFTPYYTTKQHGTGLGLAIVQSVVSDHHGNISVDSEPGKGTTFRIDLPLRASTTASSSAVTS
jgi:signal transduction histidine kinase